MNETIAEFERALIGSILRRPDSIHHAAAAGLTSSHFASVAAREAFCAVLQLDMDDVPVNPVNVAQIANQSVSQLRSWADDGTPSAVGFYAREVMQAAAQRKLNQELKRLTAMSEHLRPEEVLAEASALAEIYTAASNSQSVADFVDAAMDTIDPEKRGRNMYTTGLKQLDRALGGGISQTDEQFVLAADTGCGKTTVALGLAKHVGYTYGIHPLFFSLEMGGVSIAAKLIGAEAGVPIRKAGYSANEWAALQRAAQRVRELPLRVATASPTAESIEGEIRGHVREYGSTPVFIDYMQLMNSNERNSVDRIAEVSMTLRRVGRNVGVPIIALAQLNREGSKQQKMPSKHDLKGSGQIEQDATTILMLWRPDPELAEVRAQIVKQRFSPTGGMAKMLFAWEPSGQGFMEVA